MQIIYDQLAGELSKVITRTYSHSFSLGINLLAKPYRQAIYSIYAFCRLGDEIVDSFHDHPQRELFAQYKSATKEAIQERLSLNPILHAFQQVYHQYQLDPALLEAFYESMEMDLNQQTHTEASFEKYLLGSSEVVGLMCLQVFCQSDQQHYLQLKPYAMRLGKALQKVNFLRDLKIDYQNLGRTYFPNIDFNHFQEAEKYQIEQDIATDFRSALQGIKLLPTGAKWGVYLAYRYYKALFQKICQTPSSQLLNQRIRLPNYQKYLIALQVGFRYVLNWL
jgi:phytoene/squalene synthetase